MARLSVHMQDSGQPHKACRNCNNIGRTRSVLNLRSKLSYLRCQPSHPRRSSCKSLRVAPSRATVSLANWAAPVQASSRPCATRDVEKAT
eukprot:154858-Chlamydomonas_euryale.AAC.6